MLGKATNNSLAHNESRFFMENTPPTKDQVHQVFKMSNNGGEIARVVGNYFKANFKRIVAPITTAPDNNPDIIEFAQKLFNNVVTPGGVVEQAAAPGVTTPPRTTQLSV